MPHRLAKIGVICNDLPYFVAHRLHVAQAAVRAGYAVEIWGPDQPVPPKLQEAGLPLAPLPLVRSRLSPGRDVAALIEIVKRNRDCAILHAITIKPILLTSLALRLLTLAGRKPPLFVATVPGLGTVFSESAGSSLKGRVRRWLVERVYRLGTGLPTAHFTFETEADRDFFVGNLRLPPERAHVMRGTGVDLARFYTSETRGNRPFTALFAGRLLHDKGVDVVRDAARLTAARPDIVWAIAGWRDDTPGALTWAEIEALKADPSVRFLGHVEDMATLLRSVDAVVLPTTYPEGIPRILLEAAAAQVPSITSDFAGARAIIRHGDSGILLPKTDAKTLAVAVMQMADSPDKGKALGRAAQHTTTHGGYAESDVQQAFLKIYALAKS